MGATQWLAATQRPPSLKAMVPSITASDYHEGWVYHGGAFELFFSVSWLMITLGLSRLMRERADNPRAAQELSAVMDRIEVPALNVAGWHDIFMGGTLRNYCGMRTRGGSAAARSGQRLLAGPWHH